MTEYLTVSGVSCELEQRHGIDVPPKIISDLLYQRKLDVRACPVVAGRRLVPRALLPAIVAALRQRGLVIPEAQEK